MQVNSVSLSQNAANMAFKATPEEQIFANLKDRDIRHIAFAKASNDVNDRKHNMIDKALYLSLPLAGGLSSALRKYPPELVEHIKPHNMRSFRVMQFAKSAAGWGAGLAALSVLWDVKDYLAQRVDFIKNNPVMSFIGTFAAGFGVLAAVDKAGTKLIDKFAKVADSEKVLKSIVKFRDTLNNSKVLNKVSKFVSKFPSPIKDIGRTAAVFAPLIVIAVQIGHMFNHQSVKAQVVNRNYEELKQAQQNIKDHIADEKLDATVVKKSISDLHKDYEKMLSNKPVMDAKTGEPITFEQYVKLATTFVK